MELRAEAKISPETSNAAAIKEKPRTGADLIIDLLVEQNVDTVFGYPGGAVLPIYDAMYRKKGAFRHVLTRHEQGAIFAAEGYARVTGKTGVVIATSGPGATNLITGITDAMMDSIPLVIFTGQVANTVIGTDAFQESDVLGITTPITKYNYQVDDVRDLPRIVKEAFHIASTGRPGPVVIDIPKNISEALPEGPFNSEFDLPGYQPTTKPNPMQIRKLIDALEKAKKPLVIVGAGVLFADATDELRQFIERSELPVVHTLLGKGAFPGSHPLSLGMGGMHGTYTANMAMYECDFMLNIGARFDDRLTGNLKHFAPNAKVAHIDIDPAEIGKNVKTEIPVVADAKEALKALLKKDIKPLNHREWLDHLNENKKKYPLWYERTNEGISPQWLVEKIHEHTNGGAIVTTDVGQHQMWAAQFYTLDKPHNWVSSGGLGAMGFGFPAAIGAQLGRPDDLVVSINGDGGFQMNMQELMLLKQWNLPVKVIILNNTALGMVRQWQEEFYEERYSESVFEMNPDFVKLAESFGIRGVKVDKEEDVDNVLKDILSYDGPVVADFRIIPNEKVYPMVAPGKGINEMLGVEK